MRELHNKGKGTCGILYIGGGGAKGPLKNPVANWEGGKLGRGILKAKARHLRNPVANWW